MIRQGKSASSSKCKLGSPPHAWAHSHAEAEWTRNSVHPAVNIQPASRCGSVAWRTLTSSVRTAWAPAGSAARPLGITHAAASNVALGQQVLQAFTYSWPAPNIRLLKEPRSAAAAWVCFKHPYHDWERVWASTSCCPSETPTLFCSTAGRSHRANVLPFTAGLLPTLME